MCPSAPGPSPGISGCCGGFLQLLSDWAVPGTASTRPRSSHLQREERPDSGGHRAGGGTVSPWVRASGGQQLGLLGGQGCGVGAHSPCVGLAAGPGGGGVLKVACLTGHTVSVRHSDFIWQEKSKASWGEWARGVSPGCEGPLLPLDGPSLPASSPRSTFPDLPHADRSLLRPCLCPGSLSLQTPRCGPFTGREGGSSYRRELPGGLPPP